MQVTHAPGPSFPRLRSLPQQGSQIFQRDNKTNRNDHRVAWYQSGLMDPNGNPKASGSTNGQPKESRSKSQRSGKNRNQKVRASQPRKQCCIWYRASLLPPRHAPQFSRFPLPFGAPSILNGVIASATTRYAAYYPCVSCNERWQAPACCAPSGDALRMLI